MPDPSDAVPSLVILVAPSGLLGGVREVLQDWSAVGMVQRFCWVEDPPAGGPGQATALEVEGGRATPIRLADLLPQRNSPRIRVCVLVPAFSGASALDQQVEYDLAQLIHLNTGDSATKEYLRILITRPGCGPGPSPAAQEGWHNVVVSPEDAYGPSMSHKQLQSTDDPFEIGPHAAAAVCGLTGLWAGIDSAPLDGVGQLPAEQVRVARSFFRYLDADAVEVQLRQGVLTMSAGLPMPMVGSERAVAVEDVPRATTKMATAFWDKHGPVLRGPRATLTQVPVKEIGGWQLVKEFFAFLGASLRGLPLAWSAALVNRIASGVAGTLQRRILGGDQSAYRVVVLGIDADKRPAGWRELGAAATELGELVREPGEELAQLADSDLRALWVDYVGATLTLADAGSRSPQLPPIQAGVHTGVLPDAGDCAPGPDSDFTDLPDSLQATLGVDRLHAADVLTVEAVRQHLVQARSDASSGPEAEQTLGALGRWAAGHQHSFAVRSASRLAGAIDQLRQEARALLDALAQAGGELEEDEEFRRKQRRLARWMTGLLIGLVVVLIGLGVAGGAEWLTWKQAGISAGGAVVLWFVASFLTFAQSQANFFAELRRRQIAEAQAEVNAKNLGHVALDLRRTTAAYGQHLAWSRALGAVLARPFGGLAQKTSRMTLAEDGLPLSVRLGVAQPEPAVVANAIAVERRNRFRAGWLSRPWEQYVADAPDRLGSDGLDLQDDPQRLYSARAGDGGPLATWVDLICREGPTVASADHVWRQMNIAASPQADRLIERVKVPGSASTVSLQAFMSGIDDPQPVEGRGFDGALFTPAARTEEKNQVRGPRWQRDARTGLSKAAVLVEFTGGLLAWELVGLSADEAREHKFANQKSF